MVLAPHAVIGAAIALQFPKHPILGFIFGFVSHFILDAIPHWHYSVPAIKEAKKLMSTKPFIENKKGWLDLAWIGSDFFLGIMISAAMVALINESAIFIALLGAAGGVFPDFLQFIYFAVPKPPVSTIYNFHMWIHAKKRLDDQPLIGISQQLLIIVLGVLATFIF